MNKRWRPEGWYNPYSGGGWCRDDDGHLVLSDNDNEDVFEEGANTMLNALFKLAGESPTGTFIIDSRSINIYEDMR